MLSVKLRISMILCLIVLLCSFIYEYMNSFREGMDSGSTPLTDSEYYLLDTVVKQLNVDDPKLINNFDIHILHMLI
jgi:hypothetical protein